MSKNSMSGRLYDQLKRACIANAAGICWACGHGGANSVDHVIPLAWGIVSGWDLRNWRACHGGGRVCPTCQVECNSKRQTGTRPVALNTSRQW